MKQMVISCFPDGHVEHTLKDSFFNPFPGVKRSVDRMSEILFDKSKQKFFISWLRGPFLALYDKPTKFFNTYEEAVKEEIRIANTVRLMGASFK